LINSMAGFMAIDEELLYVTFALLQKLLMP
jgi:hypothetical protein